MTIVIVNYHIYRFAELKEIHMLGVCQLNLHSTKGKMFSTSRKKNNNQKRCKLIKGDS